MPTSLCHVCVCVINCQAKSLFITLKHKSHGKLSTRFKTSLFLNRRYSVMTKRTKIIQILQKSTESNVFNSIWHAHLCNAKIVLILRNMGQSKQNYIAVIESWLIYQPPALDHIVGNISHPHWQRVKNCYSSAERVKLSNELRLCSDCFSLQFSLHNVIINLPQVLKQDFSCTS